MIRKSFTFEGKRYFVKGQTEKEVYEKMIRRKIELEQGTKRITRNTLVNDWLHEWLEVYKEPNVGAEWYRTLKLIVDTRINPYIGNLQLKSVKPIHLQKILSGMDGMSDSYIRKTYNVLKESFKKAKGNHLINENPAEDLDIVKGRKKKMRRSLTEQERKVFLKVCEYHRGGPFLKTILYCGTRPGETAALQIKDFDLDNNMLTIDRAIKQNGSIGEPKSQADHRKVFIPTHFATELKDIFKGKSPFEYAFTNTRGERHTINSIRRLWDSFTHNMNIEMGCKTFRGELIPPLLVADDLVMYCLRHTYCTDLQAAGIPLNVARELMGHAQISTTAEIYTHTSEEAIANAAACANNLYSLRCEGSR